jgi:hypothetical protein
MINLSPSGQGFDFNAGSWKRIFDPMIIKKVVLVFTLAAFLNLSIGCSYYKVNTRQGATAEQVIDFQKNNKYIILHHEQQAWQLTGISADDNRLGGVLARNYGHKYYLTTDPDGINRYKNKEVLDEIHIYATKFTTGAKDSVYVDMGDITRIELYDPAVEATTASYILTGLGVAALAFVTFMIIVLATKESCPFIYAYDGEKYRFIGEIYSGSTHPPLERHDYLALPGIEPVRGEYRLKISNEIHEIQNTNLAELEVYDHPQGVVVLVDKYGKPQTIAEAQAPASASNLLGRDVRGRISARDTLSYLGDGLGKDQAQEDGLILRFDRPEGAASAKLVIRAKNTFWLDYIFGRFHDLFGIAYGRWQEKQKHASADGLRRWMLEQKIPLIVSVQRNGQWEMRDYYNLTGPMAYRDDVLCLDLEGLGEGPIYVKLEAGSLFWEFDYVGMDFSRDLPVQRTVVPLKTAVNEKGEDVKDLLSSDDGQYYIQPEIGNQAILAFTAPRGSSRARTVVLHSKGHYQILRNPSGRPDREYLESFREKGQFVKFSNQLIRTYLERDAR